MKAQLMIIRKYDTEDTNQIVAIWRRASELAHPFLSVAFLDAEAEALRNIYLKYAQTSVLCEKGQAVGFIAMVEGEIAGLFLLPEYHGRGYGAAMVNHALTAQGELTVEVFANNKIGRHFYNAFGFRETGRYIHEKSGQETLKLIFKPS